MTLSTDKAAIVLETIEHPWICGSWEEYLVLSDRDPKAKANYFRGSYQLIMGIGADHGIVNTTIAMLVMLFCTIKGIPHRGLINTSYRKEGVRECQPDVSYYIQESVNLCPKGSSVVDLDEYAPPNLVIEISNSSLSNDIGIKRMLYEEMRVQEYWVIDVQRLEIVAFTIHDNLGSQRISESRVLTGLAFPLIEQALQKSQEEDNSQIGQWFMGQIKS